MDDRETQARNADEVIGQYLTQQEERLSELIDQGAAAKLLAEQAERVGCIRFNRKLVQAIVTSVEKKRRYVFGLRTFRQNNIRQIYVQTKPRRDDVLRNTRAILSAGGIDERLVQTMFPYANIEFAHAKLAPGTYYLEQCVDKAFSTSSLLGAEERNTARDVFAPRRRDEALSRLAREIALYERFFWNRAAKLETPFRYDPTSDGQEDAGNPTLVERCAVLVACAKKVAPVLRARLAVIGAGERVVILTFCRLRGLDVFGSVPAAVAIGRATPSVFNLELDTEALFADSDLSEITLRSPAPWDSDEICDTWIKGKRTLRLVGNRGVEIDCDLHPDDNVERVRRSRVDNENQQFIERLRIINRTADNPAYIFVFGQCDVGLPVHRLRPWGEVDADVGDMMLADGVAFTREGTVRGLYPHWVRAREKEAQLLCQEITERLTALVDWTALKTPHSAIDKYKREFEPCAVRGFQFADATDTTLSFYSPIFDGLRLRPFQVRLESKPGESGRYTEAGCVDLSRFPNLGALTRYIEAATGRSIVPGSLRIEGEGEGAASQPPPPAAVRDCGALAVASANAATGEAQRATVDDPSLPLPLPSSNGIANAAPPVAAGGDSGTGRGDGDQRSRSGLAAQRHGRVERSRSASEIVTNK